MDFSSNSHYTHWVESELNSRFTFYATNEEEELAQFLDDENHYIESLMCDSEQEFLSNFLEQNIEILYEIEVFFEKYFKTKNKTKMIFKMVIYDYLKTENDYFMDTSTLTDPILETGRNNTYEFFRHINRIHYLFIFHMNYCKEIAEAVCDGNFTINSQEQNTMKIRNKNEFPHKSLYELQTK